MQPADGTPIACLLRLQEMTNDDLQTQRQMVHLDTEIKELEVWALNMAKMADIFTAARKIFGELRPPRKDEFDPSLLTESALYRTQGGSTPSLNTCYWITPAYPIKHSS